MTNVFLRIFLLTNCISLTSKYAVGGNLEINTKTDTVEVLTENGWAMLESRIYRPDQ